MSDNNLIDIYEIAKAGKNQEARGLLAQFLKSAPENADAWILMAVVIDDQQKSAECLRRAMNIRPDDDGLQAALDLVNEGIDLTMANVIPPEGSDQQPIAQSQPSAQPAEQTPTEKPVHERSFPVDELNFVPQKIHIPSGIVIGRIGSFLVAVLSVLAFWCSLINYNETVIMSSMCFGVTSVAALVIFAGIYSSTEHTARSKQQEEHKAKVAAIMSEFRPIWGELFYAAIQKKVVIPGMTSEMVLVSWGRPSNIDDKEVSSRSTKERWIYGIPRRGARYVWFRNGRVSKVKLP